jgi:hypothetical protein
MGLTIALMKKNVKFAKESAALEKVVIFG